MKANCNTFSLRSGRYLTPNNSQLNPLIVNYKYPVHIPWDPPLSCFLHIFLLPPLSKSIGSCSYSFDLSLSSSWSSLCKIICWSWFWSPSCEWYDQSVILLHDSFISFSINSTSILVLCFSWFLFDFKKISKFFNYWFKSKDLTILSNQMF